MLHSLLIGFLLGQTASNVVVVDPTFQSSKVTTTAAGAKRGLDVNITGGTVNIADDGGTENVNVASWGGTTTTLGQKVMASSVSVTFASDQSALTCNQGTPPWSVVGTKSNNAAAPSTTNVGALSALANASTPAWTEGNLVLMSVDLSGRQRTDTSSIAGTTTSTGNGVSGAGVQRVVIASDQTAFSVNSIQSGAWTITTTPPTNASTNVAQFGGTNVNTGTGASGVGIPRVTISNDSSLAANQSVNISQIAAAATLTGNGVTGTGSQRVTIASDNTSFSVGTKTNNAAAPGATNVGALSALANAANPTWTEGNLVLASVDLAGRQRANLSAVGGTATVSGGLAGTLGVGGTQANNTAITDNPSLQGFEALSTQPTAATTGNIRRGVASLDGAQYVRLGGPVPWSCSLDNIGATLTQCQAAPGAGLKLYLTDIMVQSTTAIAGQFLVRFGTGVNCGTGTTSLLPAAATVVRLAYPSNTATATSFSFLTPLSATAANAICILCVVTNTCTVQMSGFTAP